LGCQNSSIACPVCTGATLGAKLLLSTFKADVDNAESKWSLA